jgi:hypothetical protein
MTIRLEKTTDTTYANSRGVRLVIQSTVAVDTEAEALAAKRAFELVLAPRFTRDEAIAIVQAALYREEQEQYMSSPPQVAFGIRLALEALAAAGVFVDGCPAACGARECADNLMAAKLDAAGIR